MTYIYIYTMYKLYIYIYIYIYIYLLTPGSSCFSLVFIKNLINDKSKPNKNMLLFVLYCPGPFTVIYNMYNSMTS